MSGGGSKANDIRRKFDRLPSTDDTDYSFFDVFPGIWMLRHDPSVQSLMHNHEMFPMFQYIFVVGVMSISTLKWLRMANRVDSRPLFVVNKKTWLNTKVPRRRARFYDKYWFKLPQEITNEASGTWHSNTHEPFSQNLKYKKQTPKNKLQQWIDLYFQNWKIKG